MRVTRHDRYEGCSETRSRSAGAALEYCAATNKVRSTARQVKCVTGNYTHTPPSRLPRPCIVRRPSRPRLEKSERRPQITIGKSAAAILSFVESSRRPLCGGCSLFHDLLLIRKHTPLSVLLITCSSGRHQAITILYLQPPRHPCLVVISGIHCHNEFPSRVLDVTCFVKGCFCAVPRGTTSSWFMYVLYFKNTRICFFFNQPNLVNIPPPLLYYSFPSRICTLPLKLLFLLGFQLLSCFFFSSLFYFN